MNRTVIVAKIQPDSQQSVAQIFAASDATSLPHDLGVRARSLYSLNDLYLHVIEFAEDPTEALRKGPGMAGFKQISDDLRAYIKPYDPQTWKSPQDAVAREFYHWRG
ncbi:polyketide synthase [Asanoa ishikariensis]|uniref:Cyclase n=1 Tax=Asanoa ishikariensis TaxID=137265 RepID=A0A1H3UEY3_9ACTN|nr:TcmI family type II polyketide cyclase [Asanoa ishikariensis]GIF63717.1 polyketide synthase [Asanoa ishikariensis]SDZ60837.1 cyclase [Asanoa ishikariensis]